MSMNLLSGLIGALDVRRATALPALHSASKLIVASDYGGQHQASKFEALAFVLADADRLGGWLRGRGRFRAEWLPDARRMSFKKLSDRQRAAALPAFLELADQIHGLLFVVLIDKQIDSLFADTQEQSKLKTTLDATWRPKTIEKALRICHCLSLLLAGLSSELQDVLWVTDQDDVAANTQRHGDLVEMFSTILGHYLEHTLGHIRIATTLSDTGKRDLEDLVSIADLAAGAVGQVINESRSAGHFPGRGLIFPMASAMPLKMQRLMSWFSDSRSNLKRLVFVIEPVANSLQLTITQMDFVGSTNLRPKFF